MAEKTSAKPTAPVAAQTSPTTMAWSAPIASLRVSVKALKDSGGFGKIMEKVGLAMTDSDLLYSKADSTPIKSSGSVIEIDENALTNGRQKFFETLASAGIDFVTSDASSAKFRIF